jgi:hypothetical protein
MATEGMPSPLVRILLGLLCLAGGAVPMLAAFDLGPLDSGAINGPPWLGFLAGAVFVVAGIALFLGERLRHGVLSHGLLALILGVFAAIGSWVAFGPGPRACTIAFEGFLFDTAWANDIVCRVGFGIGAVMVDGMVLVAIAATLRALLGPGALPRAIETLGVVLILIALAPILLPTLLFGVGRILLESYATWRATGRWPRNEGFIRRMKAKRAARP